FENQRDVDVSLRDALQQDESKRLASLEENDHVHLREQQPALVVAHEELVQFLQCCTVVETKVDFSKLAQSRERSGQVAGQAAECLVAKQVQLLQFAQRH